MRLLPVLACAVALHAQAPSEPAHAVVKRVEEPLVNLVRQWIRDPLPERRAWAAYLSVRLPAPSFDTELIAALNQEEADVRVRDAILSALIERGSGIPESAALALFPRNATAATILLYRNDACPSVATSVAIMNAARADDVWLAAAHCLASQDGGPVELLQHMQVKAGISVFDSNVVLVPRMTPSGTVGGVIGSVNTDWMNWPPQTSYRLSTRPGPKSVVLFGGTHPVYYGTSGESSALSTQGERDQYALDLLAAAAGVQQMGLASLRWITPEQGHVDLQALAAEQRQRYAEMLSRLEGRGLLTPVERTRCPESIEIVVSDGRGNRNSPLPAVVR
jgi:hypothetical protein